VSLIKFRGINEKKIMKIGNYELKVIHTGYFYLDGGAMFGIIPKPLWERSNPADDKNRIKLSTRNLLLKSDSEIILIDTGMGEKWDDKAKDIYNMSTTPIEEALKKEGVERGDVTDVILTHLHFDHTGGSTKMEEGKVVPTFPNAKYHVAKKNFEWGMNPSERDRGSYLKENFLPLKEEGILRIFEGDSQFNNNISFIEVNGHTFGQQLIKIKDESNTLVYCGDLLPTVSHVRLPYIMGYDLQPLVTLEEKKRLLPIAAEEEWLLFFEHDPEIAAATVTVDGKGINLKEKYGRLPE
jgi:glyoxylase-like metal-dependent hydrolase (beta-lactamase superfamily II)